MASDVLISCAPDQKEKDLLFRNAASNVLKFHRLMSAQKDLLAILDSEDIPVIVLKGAAAAQYYPAPELRQMGDIDILVPPRDFERAYGLLCRSGYRDHQTPDDSSRRHVGFTDTKGTEIELHRYFSLSGKTESEKLLDSMIFDGMEHARVSVVCGYSVPVLPPLENGLVLLEHIEHHLGSGLGLRQIVDWFYFVRNECDDAFWNETFGAAAEAVGMKKLAVVLTKMCVKYLGLNGSVTWCDGADDGLVDELTEYIMKKGNFGRKIEKNRNVTVSITHHLMSNPADAFAYLTSSGMKHMEEAGLRPVKAFAWLYQIGRLIHRTLKRRGRFDLVDELRTGMKETDLLKRLEIKRL